MQATVQQGDASDEETIENLVKRAMQEEGRLDVFYANVSTPSPRQWAALKPFQAGVATIDSVHNTSTEVFMRVMRINALSWVRLHMGGTVADPGLDALSR